VSDTDTAAAAKPVLLLDLLRVRLKDARQGKTIAWFRLFRLRFRLRLRLDGGDGVILMEEDREGMGIGLVVVVVDEVGVVVAGVTVAAVAGVGVLVVDDSLGFETGAEEGSTSASVRLDAGTRLGVGSFRLWILANGETEGEQAE
jgi:hypothetical protein